MNLFLAWLPMLSAPLAHHLHKQGRRLVWLLIVPCLLFWLFFPNAPYILTDMLHLQWPQARVPVWYDLILLIAFAWTGAFLGLISLFLVHGLVRQWAGRPAGWLVTLGVIAVSGFGVYLGRFPRWNSWDLLTNPSLLLMDIWTRLSNPLANSRTFVFSVLALPGDDVPDARGRRPVPNRRAASGGRLTYIVCRLTSPRVYAILQSFPLRITSRTFQSGQVDNGDHT